LQNAILVNHRRPASRDEQLFLCPNVPRTGSLPLGRNHLGINQKTVFFSPAWSAFSI
jgi:hypothetical protein